MKAKVYLRRGLGGPYVFDDMPSLLEAKKAALAEYRRKCTILTQSSMDFVIGRAEELPPESQDRGADQPRYAESARLAKVKDWPMA